MVKHIELHVILRTFRIHVEAGGLLALFSGNRISKGHSRKGVRWGDEEWSDFRLTLDKSVLSSPTTK